jgi:hypothetical protein
MTATQKTVPGKQPAYVYRCVHKETQRFYIGYREANNLPPSQDLGKAYFTSSKLVSKNFSNYNCEVLAEYATGKMAFDVEQRLLFELRKDPLLINTGIPNSYNKLIPVDLDIFGQELEKANIRRQMYYGSIQSIIDGIKILRKFEDIENKKKRSLLYENNKFVIEAAKKFLSEKLSVTDNFKDVLSNIRVENKKIMFCVELT